MTSTKILVVEDEPAVRELLSATLESAGYQIILAADAQLARDSVIHNVPDLILLDWMLPGMTGLDFAKWMKKDDYLAEVPIILLTARDAENDKVQGLDAGVDDYVTKPFSTRELLSRIKAILRRTKSDASKIIRTAVGLEMDLEQHRVLGHGEPIHMAPTEFKLLHFFLLHQDRVYSRGQLLDMVWGRNVYIEERTVDVHIRRLRKALKPYGFEPLVQTVRSVGYRFSIAAS
jgi:two-component system phosphate regulon response regulator PhoB